MRLVIDTSVLVRYFVWDDEAQAAASARIIEGGDDSVIPTVILCETVRILQHAYRYPAKEIPHALRVVLESTNAAVDRPAAEAGLATLARGGDFADGGIGFDIERTGASHLVTFDHAFAPPAEPAKVRLLDV